MNLQEKDWVNHIIIAIGILVGLWIIIGFVIQVRYFLGYQKQELQCENCITIADNNYQQTIDVSAVIVLELPSTYYSEENLIMLQNPTDSFVSLGSVPPHRRGNWALQFQAKQEGYVDIVIKSNQVGIADFHTIIIIQ